MELTGYDYERQHRVHLLCYWPQDCPQLRAHCDTMRRRRNECCLQSAREIEAMYPQFRTEQALEYAKDSGVLFKSGIMQALQELGLCQGIYGELYHYLFGWNPRGVVLHSPEYLPVEEVIETARATKGRADFRPSHVYKSMPLVRQLVAEGKLDGIEIVHPEQRGGQGRVPGPVREVRADRDGGHRFPRVQRGPSPSGGDLRHGGRQIARINDLARRRQNNG